MITDKYSVEDDEKTKQIFDKYLKLKQNFLKLQKLYYVSYCYNPSEKKIKNKLLGVFLRHVLEKIFESIDDNILNTILESTSWQTDLQEDKNIGDRIARIHLIIENISKKICDKKLNQDQIKLDVDIICSLNKINADLALAEAKEQPSSDKINADLVLAKAKEQPSDAPSCPDAETCGNFFFI